MKTAIIDNGIDLETLSLYSNNTKNLAVMDGKIVSTEPPCKVTHGGLCARIYAGQAGVLPDVSICLDRDDFRRSNHNDLVTALEWCADNGVKLISLSMGTTRFSDAPALYKMVEKLCNAGTILVAAANNDGLLTYPAVFDSCIGVASCPKLKPGSIVYLRKPFDGIDVVTYPVSIPDYYFSGTNSLSTAFVAGMIHREFGGEVCVNDVRRCLSERSPNTGDRWKIDYLKEKTSRASTNEAIIIMCNCRTPKQSEMFLTELRKHIIQDGYTCAVLLEKGNNKPFDFLFSFDASPMTMENTLEFVSKSCHPSIILLDSQRMACTADILVCDSELENVTVVSQVYRIDDTAPDNLWLRIRELYEKNS